METSEIHYRYRINWQVFGYNLRGDYWVEHRHTVWLRKLSLLFFLPVWLQIIEKTSITWQPCLKSASRITFHPLKPADIMYNWFCSSFGLWKISWRTRNWISWWHRRARPKIITYLSHFSLWIKFTSRFSFMYCFSQDGS